MISQRILLLSAVYLSCFFLFCGCKNQEMTSSWRDHEIVIDGTDEDWEGTHFYYNEELHLRVGMFNDDQFLYISIAASDRKISRQILDQNFTLWFDASGGETQTFGLRTARTGPPRDIAPRGTAPEIETRPMPDETPLPLPDLHVLGTDDKLLAYGSMKDASKWSIFAMLRFLQGRVVYELKIPLVKSDQARYAIGIGKLPETISVGFTTGKAEMERGKNSRGPRGGGPPGGMSGGPPGRYMEGGPDRHGGAHGPQSITPINLWVKVHLSGKPL
jgi:hypothetical protein